MRSRESVFVFQLDCELTQGVRIVNDVDDLVALLVEVHGEFNTGLVDDFELQVRSAVVQVGVERDLAPAGRVV